MEPTEIRDDAPAAAPIAAVEPPPAAKRPRTEGQMAALAKAKQVRAANVAARQQEKAKAKAEAWAERKKDRELSKLRRLYRDSLDRLSAYDMCQEDEEYYLGSEDEGQSAGLETAGKRPPPTPPVSPVRQAPMYQASFVAPRSTTATTITFV